MPLYSEDKKHFPIIIQIVENAVKKVKKRKED